MGIAVPQYSAQQNDILEFMCEAYDDEVASRKLRLLFHSSDISTRYSVLPDFGDNHKEKRFFVNEDQPDVENRMTIYRDNAVNLGVKAINDLFGNTESDICPADITHLIAVTCTGLYSPGIDAEIMKKFNLSGD